MSATLPIDGCPEPTVTSGSIVLFTIFPPFDPEGVNPTHRQSDDKHSVDYKRKFIHRERRFSIRFPLLGREIPSGRGKAASRANSSRHIDWHSHDKPSNSLKSPLTAYLSIAATTNLSQLPSYAHPYFSTSVG